MRMMKFHLSLVLAFSFFMAAVIPQGAQAGTVINYEMELNNSEERIAQVFDKFHYTMNVEWDQKDEDFKKQAEADLETALKELQAEGITSEEIQSYVTKTILGGKSQKEFSRMQKALGGQNLSRAEVADAAMDFLSSNYQEGASFAGGHGHHGNWKLIICVIIVVVVIKCCLDRKDGGREIVIIEE